MLSHTIQFFIVAPTFFVFGTVWNYIHTINIKLNKDKIMTDFTSHCSSIEYCSNCKYLTEKRKTALNDVWCFKEYLEEHQIELMREEEF